jgi:LysM repeat protein
LKKAGYATDPSYAGTLIRVIEENKLYTLDREVAGKPTRHNRPLPVTGKVFEGRTIYERNRIQYIIAKKGDSFESLTNEFGKLPWELTRYNDLPSTGRVDSGQIIYIQPKRNSAAPGNRAHTVKEGETMYTISQLYGIKLNKLYEKNGLTWQSKLPAGTVLQLRKRVKPLKINLGQPAGKDKPSVDEEEMYFEMED